MAGACSALATKVALFLGIAVCAATTAPVVASTPPRPAPLFAYSSSWVRVNPQAGVEVQAAAAVLVDLDTHQVLWQRGAHDLRAPASLTKLITVLVALDHSRLTDTITVPAGAVDSDPEQTTMGLNAGDQVTVRELMYGIFLDSANDAAEALAQTLIPRDQFIAEMNEKAAALGMEATHFVNPTGLDEPGHQSSAYDLALATGYLAARYPELLEIAQQPEVSLYASVGHPEYDLVNLNKLILWPYPGATGLKTGFTDAAGGCVAATAERDGRHLAAVVLGSDVMFTDAAKLLDYGWSSAG
jgi:D-alanyl-D-alanine carboxypeptidase (penicillin-binding protein 5/6)